MNEGEAARTAFAIAQITDLIARFDDRLNKLEHAVMLGNMSIEQHGTEIDILRGKVFPEDTREKED